MATTADAVRTEPPAYRGNAIDPTYYQHERYLGTPKRSGLLSAYYTFKPLIPRDVQLRLRRWYAPRQARRTFPAWPIEPILVEREHNELRRAMNACGVDRIPAVSYWPRGHGSACILSHDVEGPPGVENINRVLAVERRHGFVSSWNFVGEDYAIPDGTFEWLRDEGCEIGLHGIRHDGKLFQSRARFEADLPKIRAYLEQWGASGFRSPATHRRAAWMHELGCVYDSSFPDTDPFEPQPGGCCSIFPFMLGDVVELPITLVQDHTLWEILRQRSIDLWRHKSEWVIRHHGLVNVITHPDYFTSPERFSMYDSLLAFLARQPGCWRALPHEVASWWRARARTACESTPHGPRIVGEAERDATVMWACAAVGGHVEFEI